MNTSQLEPLNQFPDCVFMKLHTLTQPEALPPILISASKQQNTTTKNIDLKLTIRFGEQEIKAPGGCVRFGLKRGNLKLGLENCKIPLETMGLIARFENEIELEVQQENGKEAEVHAAAASSMKFKGTNKKSTKSKYRTCQCHTQGTEIEPVWVFQAKTEEPILKGQITEERLGKVEIITKPCAVKAKFEVRGQRDLYLSESEGLFGAKNLSRNRTALFTRHFFLQFIESKLQPYLSQVEVRL